MQEAIDKLNSGIQEALTNVRVIKSFVREDHEEEKFAANNSNLMDKSLRAMNIVIATMPVMMLAMNITTLAVVWYGGNMIIGGTMQVGDLTAFTTYIVQILMSLMMLSMVFLQSSRAMASAKRVNEVMDTEIDLTDDHAARKDALVTKGKVEFQDVSFHYGEEEKGMVLEHITFTANPGETITEACFELTGKEGYIRVNCQDSRGLHANSNAYEMNGTVPFLRPYDMTRWEN